MRSAKLRVHAKWRVLVLAGLAGLIATPAILAAPLPPAPGLGAKILGTGEPVVLRTVPTDAALTSDISRRECVPIDCTYVILGTNRDKAEFALGTIPKGKEIELVIFVQETGDQFHSGSAGRNPDGLAHAFVRPKDATTLQVEFEDLYGGGDRDFNDVIVEIEGARMSVPFVGLPVSPLPGSDLALGQGETLQVLPLLAGGESGVSISLGEAEGWQGTVNFDGQVPNAQLTYTVQSMPGPPDLVGRHTTSPANGITDLEVIFPRATQRGLLQVDAFLGGQKVASTQVQPEPDSALTFAPVRYLESATTKVKKIKIKKVKIGPVVIEGIEIVFGATSGEIEGVGNLDFDTLELTFQDSGLPAAGLSEVALGAANVPSLTLESQSVSAFQHFHRGLGGATLEARNGALTMDYDYLDEDSPGVAVEVDDAESFVVGWSPFIPLGLTLGGSSLEINARGTVHGVPDQDLGTLRVLQLTMADSDAEITADFSAVGSPTQRVLVYDKGNLIADVSGLTGAAARALAWPTGVGKGDAVLGELRLPGYSLPFPEDTWIRIPDGRWMTGDKLLVLAENPSAEVESVSLLSLRTSRLPPITLAGEETGACCLIDPGVIAVPNLKISVQWGSTGVGAGPYGTRLTAFIAVENTSGVDCHPPSTASFVVGAYYKRLGLVKAKATSDWPAVIKAGETRNFIAQSLDDSYQDAIYNGHVDFYVSSQAPGAPDLSAAIRPACKGEVDLSDNNAHSVKNVIANP